ncbi:glycosyltransferase family 39 protein [Ktedonosporobacter rubrisoli]|uniref:Glycosyltransferase family 39 protein n=1 Tax=Ktedonosporobacter rubrisoli TaxID=2509675 RepID=A0A4P6K1N9_KTERU|nr:glycosyltransferase family 39 protein [Ktedonosporobacter rubrisoli]QBD82098.1 glycosyltransferase family 39 protein [Ktedonosporobacter rubrisoli]
MLRVKNVDSDASLSTQQSLSRSWLLAWDFYLVLLIAGVLRFYQIHTTEFDDDQAMLFRMAYDGLHHGLLPVTSNIASIGIAHPPGVIYLFMLPAALSSDPLWAAMMVSMATTLAAVLTYLFTRRYYGRLAGLVAALLYATAARPLNYARFIWQPNLMPPFVILFLFVLFLGVVDRRKGWFCPALLLLGLLYQMHPTTSLLIIPLIAAFLLAPGTVRWRDLAFALAGLLVIFSPYILWEAFTHLADLHTVFRLVGQRARIDSQAIHLYRSFLSPFDTPPSFPGSLLRKLAPWLSWLRYAVPLLAVGGFVTAGICLLRPHRRFEANDEPQMPSYGKLPAWLRRLQADPYRCGILLLLIWQLGPSLFLLRHAVDLHSQYFFMLMPGPFILIGLLSAKIVALLRHYRPAMAALRYVLYVGIALIVCAQLLGSMALVIDNSSGNFDDRGFQPYPYHNDLASLQNALTQADQLAQRSHYNRVYITSDTATQAALSYLAAGMRTPTTLFDASRCLLLPDASAGPAVFLVGPYDDLTNALLGQSARATLVDAPKRLGGAPFKLYVVKPAAASSVSAGQLGQDLQLLDARAEHVTVKDTVWTVTRWKLLRSAQPAYRTTYSYALTGNPAQKPGVTMQSRCTFTSIRAGDQLLVAFKLSSDFSASSGLEMQAISLSTVPYLPTYGPFRLETADVHDQHLTTLLTPKGDTSLPIAIGSTQ